ncbi:UvrD-helicase domain-containing protein [Dyadobacter sp. Leaf189]|uniref:UvrD-helicase domain-containing protein n=1 Tax=Dyadobacter sp. Leaf189 TaxID=1736295 RepID=UPI0006FD8B10|nr:ATP-dependent helicase [Dyadobacter sp. Leaf189]KQS26585.1 DNA helicase UvrD [Dyadobacter sp. Leaf189]
MKKVDEKVWTPADGLFLEDNALQVIKSKSNNLVIAGPGAGKTELLAQKAGYLLQTNVCKYPGKILAISFKRDAAFNLKDRVSLRLGEELAKRFDSMTFDSFAKQILDRFMLALPADYHISSDYNLTLSDNLALDLYKLIDKDFFFKKGRTDLVTHHTKVKLSTPLDFSKSQRAEVWRRMLRDSPSQLTFKMIMRLAELIIARNPRIRTFLQQTYSHVFLDEFQDATTIQYEFFKTCFLNSDLQFTAVGDDKQRIMVWAGARETIFEDFEKDQNAVRVALTTNFRCAPRLIKLLNYLTEHLLNKRDFAIPPHNVDSENGECSVWKFADPEMEMKYIFEAAKSWISSGVAPRDICILVKQQLERYAGGLIEYLNRNGINARDESKYQELLTDDVILYIIYSIENIVGAGSLQAKSFSLRFLRNLHSEYEDEKMLKLEIAYFKFCQRMLQSITLGQSSSSTISEMISKILDFAGRDRIMAYFPNYNNATYFNSCVASLESELLICYARAQNLVAAISMIKGEETIPVMTIHKSKGLEYHSVVFVGLEDSAFWTFERQPDEDKSAFFVALSRAKERVIFTFCDIRDGRTKGERQANKKIRVFFDQMESSGLVNIRTLGN